MDRTSAKVKSFKRQGITILVLVVLLGAYYALVVPARRADFIDRNFRLLAEMSAQISATVNNLGNSLSHAANPNRDWIQTLQPGSSPILQAIKAAHSAATSPSENGLDQIIEHIQSAIQLVPNLELVGPLTTNVFSAVPAEAISGVCLGVRTLRNSNWLELTYSGAAPEGTPLFLTLKARSELHRLIAPIVSRPEFDNVLVIGPDKNVLFQRSQTRLQLHRLEVPTDQSSQTNLNHLAGAAYTLFTQPVQLLPMCSEPGTPVEWVVCGLVRADRLRQESRAVNYTLVVLFLFLTLLLIVSWPLLNVWSMGPQGSLGSGDLVLLAFSTLTTSALLTLLVIDLYAYFRMEAKLDAQERTLAGDLVQHFKEELRAAARQLDALNGRVLDPNNAVNQVHLLANPQALRLDGDDPDPYPYLQMVFWTDRAGRQLLKWTVQSNNTPLINISRRDYFRQLMEDRPWILSLQDGSGNAEARRVPFSLEPVYSLNTGEYLAIFSMFPPDETELIASMDMRLLSFGNPVLPSGYGFCVIENSGRVLFHSDEQRSLRENFFEECNQDPRLRAAVYGRHTAAFDTQYAQRPHSVVVTPIPELPWSLAVFREEQYLSTAQIEVVSISLVLFLSYATLLAALFGAFYIFQSGSYLEWLWPDHDRLGTYRFLAILYLVLSTVFLLFILSPANPWWVLLLTPAFPTASLILAYRALRQGWPTTPRWRALMQQLRFPGRHRTGYVACMGLLLALTSVLPTVAIFKLVFESELRLLIKQTQRDLARDLETRAQRIWRDLDGLLLPGWHTPPANPDPERNALYERRCANDWDIYSGFFFGSTNGLHSAETAPPRARRGNFNDFLARFRPHYNDLDVQTRSVTSDGAADSRWWWIQSNGWLVLHRADFYDPVNHEAPTLAIGTALPGLPIPTVPWAAGLLSLSIVPFFVAYLIGTKVLLLGLDPPGAVSPSVWGPGKYLLLGPPRTGKSEFLSGTHFTGLHARACRRLDLRRLADRELLDPSRQDELLGNPDQSIVVDHLEYHLEDAPFNRRKLQFLQRLLFDEQRTVVVVSNVHPLHFSMDPPPGPHATPGSGPSLDCEGWREVLETFKPIYRDAREADGVPPTDDGETSQLARVLYRALWLTCSPDEQEVLQEVAQRRLINNQNPDLRNLLGRGLLRREPRLLVFNPSFRNFVLVNYRPTAAVLHRQGQTNLWQSLKGPTATALIIIACFFFFTQQDLWNQSIAFLTAFVTGIGVLSKGFELFHRDRLQHQAEQ